MVLLKAVHSTNYTFYAYVSNRCKIDYHRSRLKQDVVNREIYN
jgi:hypothetical protein